MKTTLQKGTPSDKGRGTGNVEGKVNHGIVFLRYMRTALLRLFSAAFSAPTYWTQSFHCI